MHVDAGGERPVLVALEQSWGIGTVVQLDLVTGGRVCPDTWGRRRKPWAGRGSGCARYRSQGDVVAGPVHCDGRHGPAGRRGRRGAAARLGRGDWPAGGRAGQGAQRADLPPRPPPGGWPDPAGHRRYGPLGADMGPGDTHAARQDTLGLCVYQVGDRAVLAVASDRLHRYDGLTGQPVGEPVGGWEDDVCLAACAVSVGDRIALFAGTRTGRGASTAPPVRSGRPGPGERNRERGARGHPRAAHGPAGPRDSRSPQLQLVRLAPGAKPATGRTPAWGRRQPAPTLPGNRAAPPRAHP